MAAGHEDLSRTHDVKTPSNRGFGWVFTSILLIMGLWPLPFGGVPRWWSLGIAALLMLITLAAPALLALPNRLWLRFGLLLNRIISPVVMAFLFYAVVTPMGALMRVVGKDSLRLRCNDANGSYWIKREPPGPTPASLRHQF